jgi:hypothetical protein
MFYIRVALSSVLRAKDREQRPTTTLALTDDDAGTPVL